MSGGDKKNLISLIFTAFRLIRERAAGHGKVNQFSLTQFKVLNFVAEKGTPTMKDVANFLYITSPSATAIINRLIEAKELERIYDKKDRRIVRLKLTKKGKRSLVGGRAEITARMSKIIESLNKKEKKDFANILSKIINAK